MCWPVRSHRFGKGAGAWLSAFIKIPRVSSYAAFGFLRVYHSRYIHLYAAEKISLGKAFLMHPPHLT